ncbi:phospholipase [Erwinia persicina]|uniref:phospholipase D-like domain-containing protein n=1 Tax=Erwinia persicina TaxID=55211 RepID=UPI00210444C1|nr:phospholipase D-like domain-containing protein [Erwinia persicina]MCQ4103235.1 phospholipase [Erwinia persicina]UTX13415.1 phospholipase [Erwinia persicina]
MSNTYQNKIPQPYFTSHRNQYAELLDGPNGSKRMSQPDIVVPVIFAGVGQCVITPPWFVPNTEYPPAQATWQPLVNGEEAFASVYYAIASARKSVDIVCWGFQPSMYFVRDGKAPCIGELLCNIARDRGVQVRILGWEMPLNAAGAGDEANLPGKGAIRFMDRAGQSSTDQQYAYDCQWFKVHSYAGEGKDVLAGLVGPDGWMTRAIERRIKLKHLSPLFVGRGFDMTERAEIAYRAAFKALDKDLSASTVGIMSTTATHHQKTVLVDFELPQHAVGFVMGHNMLDEYWDTDAHSSRQRIGSADAFAPNQGARGFLPRQDISGRVTGPILEHLHENFATAWKKETGQDLLALRGAKAVASELKLRVGYGTPLMAQLLRTQAQEKRRDIEKVYLKAVNNATQFIYIENQYFRWPPLAEVIKQAAATQTAEGRDPGKHGALHLFVVTNVTDQGIGAGTVNTQRMLVSLGRADTIPEVTKLRQIGALEKTKSAILSMPLYSEDMNKYKIEKAAEVDNEIERVKDGVILPETRPGLKVHVCSLVAADSPPEAWVPVYIHSKLMIIDDVFTTHGSANMNTRSMQVDSEMNIAHEWASATRKLRKRLWKLHTSGENAGEEANPDSAWDSDDAGEAFKAWEKLLKKNEDNQNPENRKQPVAPLIKFLYNEPTLKDLD